MENKLKNDYFRGAPGVNDYNLLKNKPMNSNFIDLTAHIQLGAYRKSVVACCFLDNDNPHFNSTSMGRIFS